MNTFPGSLGRNGRLGRACHSTTLSSLEHSRIYRKTRDICKTIIVYQCQTLFLRKHSLGAIFAPTLVLASLAVKSVRALFVAPEITWDTALQITIDDRRSRILLISEEPRGASALSVGRVTKGVVLAVANVPTIPAKRINGTGSVAVVPGVPGLADAAPGPRVAPEMFGRVCIKSIVVHLVGTH